MNANKIPAEGIDFILPWVDNEDPQWQESLRKWLPADSGAFDASAARYRNWHLLRFWFRGVEKYAPWVRKVHLVTCGQKPHCLNYDHPKLHFVNHEDYLPADALPVFSSNPIEINLHKIEGLAENFVYFNDDIFFVGPTTPDHFFHNGVPRDMGILKGPCTGDDIMSHVIRNNMALVNQKYSKCKAVWRHPLKWINPRYRGFMKLALPCLFRRRFDTFLDPHMAQPYLKSLYQETWESFQEEIRETTYHRFRGKEDLTQWLFRYCQLAACKFHPTDLYKKTRIVFEVEEHLGEIDQLLSGKRYSLLGLNDSMKIADFEDTRRLVHEAFGRKFPNKSSFEV